MSERVLVLGAGYAGLLAAVRIARRAGRRAEVTLVNATDTFVERIRMHQRAGGQPLPVRSIPSFLSGTGVRFVQGVVRAIDPAGRVVRVGDDALAYDRLVLALGSSMDVDSVPGVRDHAFTLDAGSAAALALALPAVAARGGRLLVCGGGLTGIEAATEFAECFPSLRVTLVSAGTLGEGLAPRGAAYLRSAFHRLGIDVVERTAVRALAPSTAQLDGGMLPFDLCLWACGFVGAPLLRAAGLLVNERGQALVDAHLRSASHPEVYVIGDAAAPIEPVGAPIHASCKIAMPMGAHAADNIVAALAGRPQRPFNFGDSGLCISLGRGDGLIQMRRRDGTTTDQVLTGRLGAWFKETVCRYTMWMLRLERRWFWGGYRWLHTPAPALPASPVRQLAA